MNLQNFVQSNAGVKPSKILLKWSMNDDNEPKQRG